MRGKRRRRQGRRPRIRIIPAHAGQTRHSPEACRSETDHPRACGANSVAGKLKSFVFGSSPRMRGKPRALAWQCHWIRIIPAHAGQTGFIQPPRTDSTDHPRACGANSFAFLAMSGVTGSSPRMRGKHRRPTDRKRDPRIIPAHAGQTHRPARRPRHRPDHPRACGANCFAGFFHCRFCGSSPRMRGKRTAVAIARRTPRIIPAHAGQTLIVCGMAGCGQDHPRACGANHVWHIS